MKYQQFITGFLAASCLFLLISATTRQPQNQDIPRYHLAWHTGNGEVTLYDSVTGEMEIVKYGQVNDDTNIKELIEKNR